MRVSGSCARRGALTDATDRPTDRSSAVAVFVVYAPVVLRADAGREMGRGVTIHVHCARVSNHVSRSRRTRRMRATHVTLHKTRRWRSAASSSPCRRALHHSLRLLRMRVLV